MLAPRYSLQKISRSQRFALFGCMLTAVSVLIFVPVFTDHDSTFDDRAAVSTLCSLFVAAGITFLFLAAKTPTADILRLAQSKKGVLTLGEIITTLDVSPGRALRALKQLQKVGLANPRWQELQKNIWEFPDYQELPLQETLDLAHKKGGRVSLKDLLAAGHSLDTAQQTLQTLTDKGLACQDPAAAAPTFVLAAQ